MVDLPLLLVDPMEWEVAWTAEASQLTLVDSLDRDFFPESSTINMKAEKALSLYALSFQLT